uniref:Uncharacterized protein n=1 Tax=Arion vulgaris TaxID=1028688 RepID=A0A0B7AKN3_9EUPU
MGLINRKDISILTELSTNYSEIISKSNWYGQSLDAVGNIAKEIGAAMDMSGAQ